MDRVGPVDIQLGGVSSRGLALGGGGSGLSSDNVGRLERQDVAELAAAMSTTASNGTNQLRFSPTGQALPRTPRDEMLSTRWRCWIGMREHKSVIVYAAHHYLCLDA